MIIVYPITLLVPNKDNYVEVKYFVFHALSLIYSTDGVGRWIESVLLQLPRPTPLPRNIKGHLY